MSDPSSNQIRNVSTVPGVSLTDSLNFLLLNSGGGGGGGSGDMLKVVYDTDNDGKVNAAVAADVVPWTGVTSKPATFPPQTHSHVISEVTNLQTALDGKASTSHTHTISAVTGLQTTLDGKAATVHAHDISDVTGLQTELNGKETLISTGTTSQYFRGDKSWRDFFTDVRASVLTGLSLASSTTISAADTVLSAIGKLQAQISLKADILSTREKLTAARSYYVRSDGSDSNNGLTNSAGGAFLTIQKAVDVVASLDLGIYDVTIYVGTGTWTAPVTLKTLVGAGECIIRGINADMTSTVFSVASADIFSGIFRGTYRLRYMRLVTTTANNHIAPNGGGATVWYSDIDFGSAPGSNQIVAANGALVKAAGSYKISGGAYSHISTYDNAGGVVSGITVTLTGTPAFTGAFAISGRSGSLVMVTDTFSGSATGRRYIADANGTITVSGAGETFLPGDTAGTKTNGGQYS